MPKAKAKAKPKAARKAAPKAKPKPAKTAPAKKRPQPTAAGVDPRIVAAIGLALYDEQIAAQRDEQLQGEASQWTVLARARGVR
jgi:hypothetical protein